MTYSKSTRYALYAALEMALSSEPVTAGAVAAKYDIPPGVLAKVLQQLVRAGIARGVRGVGGGYLLARPPSEITVLDVIAVHDPVRREGGCLLHDATHAGCESPPDCRIRRLFDEVNEVVSCTFASVSLETLARS